MLVDGRVGARDGIGRYTRCIVAAFRRAALADVEIHVLEPTGVARYTDAEDAELVDRARAVRADVVHALNYRIPVPAMPVPMVVTVHDSVHLRAPEHCFTDEDFVRWFSPSALDRLVTIVQWLEPEAVPDGLSRHARYFRAMLRHALRTAVAVVAPTAALAADLRECVPTAPLTVSPWGADHLPDTDARRQALAGAPYLLFVSVARPYKGIAELAAAYARSRARAGGVRLVLAGDRCGPGGQAALDLAAAGVCDAVLLGECDDATLSVLYRDAVALVHPARFESFGFAPMEAFTRGCPVIAHEVPALREVLGGHAQFVDAADTEALARAIDQAINTPDGGAARAARIAHAAQFRWDRHATELLALYRRAAAKSVARPRVLLDIRSNQRTGIHRYGTSLVRALERTDLAVPRLHVLVDASQRRDLPAHPTRYSVAVAPAPDTFVRRSDWVLAHVTEHHPDLYATTHYSLDRRIPVPFMHTVHDLHRLRFPEHAYTRESVGQYYGPGEWKHIEAELGALNAWDDGNTGDGTFLSYFRALNRFMAARARSVATVSHASRTDIVNLLGVDAAAVHLVPGGVDRRVFRPQPAAPGGGSPREAGDRAALPALRRPGRADQAVRLAAGHAAAAPRDRRPGRPAAGRCRRARRASCRGAAPARGRSGRCGGAVSRPPANADLAAMYTGAAALAVPSLSEGYHLSSAEALACGGEVIAADVPALRETTGAHAHRHAVHDPNALVRLCDDALSGRLPARAPGFPVPTWSTAARRWLFAVCSAVDNVSAGSVVPATAARVSAGPCRRA